MLSGREKQRAARQRLSGVEHDAFERAALPFEPNNTFLAETDPVSFERRDVRGVVGLSVQSTILDQPGPRQPEPAFRPAEAAVSSTGSVRLNKSFSAKYPDVCQSRLSSRVARGELAAVVSLTRKPRPHSRCW
jgi:hypothetical protein